MQFPLLTLPDTILISVLQKLAFFKTLCRLRRSDKRLDSFVDENKSSIRVPVDKQSYDFFKIDIDSLLQEAYINIYLNLGKLNLKMDQLVCAHFRSIHVEIQGRECDGLHHYSVKDLKRMPFSSIKLILYGYEPNTELQGFLGSFSFSMVALAIDPTTPFRLLAAPFIQHCIRAESFAFHISEGDDIPSILRQVKIPHIKIDTYGEQMPYILESILLCVKEDFKNRGGIQHIDLTGINKENMGLFSNDLLWKGLVNIALHKNEDPEEKSYLCFYLIDSTDGKMVVILEKYYDKILFLEDKSRENVLLNMLPYLFHQTPYDISSLWDELRTTSDLQGSIEAMMRGFKADYLFESLY